MTSSLQSSMSRKALSFTSSSWALMQTKKNNAGNGRDGTDRSNLVQLGVRGENVPLPIEQHTLFFDAATNPEDPEGRALVDKFAYLEQDKFVSCDPDNNNNDDTQNCKQLNGASAYFDGGIIEMRQRGVHHIGSTRNNDFSNRSQKGSITVNRFTLGQYAMLGLFLGLSLALCCVV